LKPHGETPEEKEKVYSLGFMMGKILFEGSVARNLQILGPEALLNEELVHENFHGHIL
jgi:hypothetical protein